MIQALLTWGPAAIWAAVLFLLSELPPDVGEVGIAVPDKVAHLGLYFVLGAALAWGRTRSPRFPVALLLLTGAGYGALDEWHQSFVPGRNPSLGDFLADCIGVVVGFLFLTWILERRKGGAGEGLDRNQ